MYDLYSDFDIDKHKENYVNYLEVIIFPDGHIEYAVPSHQEKLIRICCNKLNITRDELDNLCPQEYYADFLVWLCNISNCVSVWNNFIIHADDKDMTPEQLVALCQLSKNDLYTGKIF